MNSQRGFSIIEAIAYLAIYGAIAVAVIGGASIIMGEVNEKQDLAAITKLEADIRSSGSILDNYDVDKTDDAIDGGASSLQEFLSEVAQIKNAQELPSGKEVEFYKSDIITPFTNCYISYSFAITIKGLSASECANYWNYSWPQTVVLIKAGSTYNIDSSCVQELKDPDFCTDGDDFTLYYK